MPKLSNAKPVYEPRAGTEAIQQVAAMTREARSIWLMRGLRETKRIDNTVIAIRLAAKANMVVGDVLTESANRLPDSERSAE